MTVEVISKVMTASILPNPFQPVSRVNVDMVRRQRFGDSLLLHGMQLMPVCRRNKDGKLECGDGWQRISGARFNVDRGHKEWEMIDVDIRDLTDRQMADMVIESNTVRDDLTPIELAQVYRNYMGEFGITQEEMGKIRGVTQGEIANTVRLLDLPLDIQNRIITQEISPTHGRTLLQLAGHTEKMKEMAGKIREKGWSVAELDQSIKSFLKPQKEELKSEQKPLIEKGPGAVAPTETRAEKSGGTDETGSNTKAAAPAPKTGDKPGEKPPKKVTMDELKAVAKLRKVILEERADGVLVSVSREGGLPFIKKMDCDLGDVPLKMILEEAK